LVGQSPLEKLIGTILNKHHISRSSWVSPTFTLPYASHERLSEIHECSGAKEPSVRGPLSGRPVRVEKLLTTLRYIANQSNLESGVEIDGPAGKASLMFRSTGTKTFADEWVEEDAA
jgi:hypothetical protein